MEENQISIDTDNIGRTRVKEFHEDSSDREIKRMNLSGEVGNFLCRKAE